jgi:hypothetical protein
MGKSKKSNVYIIFEETSNFQRTFINNNLFIYILRACIHAQKPPIFFSPIRGGSLRAFQTLILNQFLGSCDPVCRGLGKKHITVEDYLGSRPQNALNKINLVVQVGAVWASHKVSAPILVNSPQANLRSYWGYMALLH